ncbi:hypothetical protein PAAG_12459 [Paracoccidioides lutzii Pb01]|uniref:Glucose-methanol-choline oxidoreductase N-terminal domain-containing protein n=1 Tax=Paracoccidioides lutzii (strain ATCC MYA-826 / Pb01) TaxID=502779 RepID=A0A0A2UZ67_PARBA|nr:hypothetical protein PAAG_12459 [Paracoccidioides lutzii Pb01]KGQ00871.1 hypothetical protein PAAG_12459 [Paracoccidioides lutzii Pb01]
MTILDEVDIIVCGGGNAGCVPAGRLAILDHNIQVLIIEAVFRPGIYLRNMKLDSKTASFYNSHPSEWLDGRRAIVPCAHILGGGSSINFMMYTRASASDYDDFKAKGWTTKELIPFMKKHEAYQRACNNRGLHGFKGPIKVSFGNYTYPVMQDFLRASEPSGIPVTDDLQDLVTRHLEEHWLKLINRDAGRRSGAAHAYIHSTRSKCDNLHLRCNTKVDKVIIENGRAVGVATVPTIYHSDTNPPRKVYRSRKQIIVSGGTLSSSLVLQQSRIGSLPYILCLRANPDVESFDDFILGDPDVQKRVFDKWNLKGTGPLATNGIDAGVKIRPTEEELAEMRTWPTN